MKENLKQPRVTIGSWLEPMKRLPGLQIDFPGHIFCPSTVTNHTTSGTKDVVQMRHCLRFEPFSC
jgi:hypothetical protein